MRALLPLLLCLACSSEPDEPPAEPACDDHPLATQACRDAGLMLADGTVTGVRCDARAPDDDSWPEGCEQLDINPATVTFCCPW